MIVEVESELVIQGQLCYEMRITLLLGVENIPKRTVGNVRLDRVFLFLQNSPARGILVLPAGTNYALNSFSAIERRNLWRSRAVKRKRSPVTTTIV